MISKLVTQSLKTKPFLKDWTDELCNWIQNQKDLVYWSGNTFSGKAFNPKSLKLHCSEKNISPMGWLDKEGKLLVYGEIVKKPNCNRLNFCRIIVRPDQRDKGYGKKFCQSLIEISQKSGNYKSIRLNVLSNNKPAISCYSSLGFEIVGRLPNARKIDNKSHDLMIMSLNLPLVKE